MEEEVFMEYSVENRDILRNLIIFELKVETNVERNKRVARFERSFVANAVMTR